MTDLTPRTSKDDAKPGVGDRRTVRFWLDDENDERITLTKARCTLIQRKPGGEPVDVTEQATQDATDLLLTVDLDRHGEWVWRLEYDDAAGTGFVETEDYRLYVERRHVPAPST